MSVSRMVEGSMVPTQLKNKSMEPVKRKRPERTPDQIARKRDQDREAQRLSRERTRRRIEELETRLAESETVKSKYEHELKRTTAERDVARQDTHDLRIRLDSACAQLEAARAHLASVAHLLGMNNAQPLSPSGTPLDAGSIHAFLDSQVPQLQSPQPSEIMPPPKSPADSERVSRRNLAQVPVRYVSRLDHGPILPPPQTARSQLGSQSSPSARSDVSAYDSPHSDISTRDCSSFVPKNTPPSCPMDSILTIFANTRRELLSKGEPEDIVLGSKNPALDVLPAIGARPDMGAHHPLSQMLADVMSKVHVLTRTAEQIAVLWLTNLSMRFIIRPSRENWERLSEWMRPVQSQISTAHPFWMDHVPWPLMRSILAERHTEYPQEEVGLPFFEALSVNWPYDISEAVIKDEATGSIVVSPAFERHLRNLNNWSLGPVFAKAHPSLSGTYRLAL